MKIFNKFQPFIMSTEKLKSIIIMSFCALSIVLMTSSCDPVLDWLSQIDPPDPIEQDTCTQPLLYIDPAFATGCLYIDEAVFTEMVLFVGPYTDTIQIGEDMSSKLKALLSLWHPEFTYQVYAADDDFRKVAFIAKGTNNHNLFNGKVFVRFNNHFSSRGFLTTTQAFIFNGALSFDEYQIALDSFPSYNYINWNGTNWDSLQYETSARKAEYCQIGRYYANFRFNAVPISQEVVDLYEQAGWDSVLH